MGYTLWRDDTLLGELVIEYPTTSTDFIGGMFVPAPAFAEHGLVQGRWPNPTATLFQHSFVSSQPHAPVATLQPAQDGAVTPEDVLQVRDARNDVVGTDSIMLYQTADIAPDPRSKLFEACAARGVSFSPWVLAVRFAPLGGNAA